MKAKFSVKLRPDCKISSLTCTSGSSLTRSSSLVLIELADVSEHVSINVNRGNEAKKEELKETEIICRLDDQLCMQLKH